MEIVIRIKNLHDYPFLHPRPENQAHVRRPSTIDAVSNVCGLMVGAQVDVLVSVNFDVYVYVIYAIVGVICANVINLYGVI
jgi:hypothetical protein